MEARARGTMNHPELTPLDQQLTPAEGWRTPGRVRVAPLAPKEVGMATCVFIKLVNKLGDLVASNLFLMLARNLRLLQTWLAFASRMMPYGEVERRDTELAILRVSWNCRCRYEWGQHVDIGTRAGVSAQDISRIPLGPDAPGWEPRIKALMHACDELHHERMISESTWCDLERYYSIRQLLEVTMLIGHYEMLAGVLNSTGLPLDEALEVKLAGAAIHVRGNYVRSHRVN